MALGTTKDFFANVAIRLLTNRVSKKPPISDRMNSGEMMLTNLKHCYTVIHTEYVVKIIAPVF